jgi:hypothetical protein
MIIRLYSQEKNLVMLRLYDTVTNAIIAQTVTLPENSSVSQKVLVTYNSNNIKYEAVCMRTHASNVVEILSINKDNKYIDINTVSIAIQEIIKFIANS